MGLFDFFKKNKRGEPEDDELYHDDKEDRWEAPEPTPEPEPQTYIPPQPPLYDEPVQKPEGWPVMEPVSITEKVMQFLQEHTHEEIELAASSATSEGMKAFQEKDFERARGFFQLGSELGDHKAQALLGSMYIQGYEVPRDLAVGRAWLRRSAEQGNRQAAEMLAKYVGESEPIAEEMYESAKRFMDTDRRTGLYYLNRAADMGMSRAQYEYGIILIREEDDEPHGVELVKRAAFGGYSRAMTYLGNAYLKGDAVPQSTSIALEWYEQAVRKNDPEAQLALGTLYAKGIAAPPDAETTVRLLTMAADAGLSEARELLQQMFSPQSTPDSGSPAPKE